MPGILYFCPFITIRTQNLRLFPVKRPIRIPKQLIIALFLLLVLTPGRLTAQNFEAGTFVGFSAYRGDLNTDRLFHKVYPAAGLVARFNHNQRLSTRAIATYTILRGSDRSTEQTYRNILGRANHPTVYYEFETSVVELSLQGEFNLLSFKQGDMVTRATPFLFAGIGGIWFSPDPMEFSNGGDQREPTGGDHWHPDDDQGYSAIALAGILGLGVKYNLSKRLVASMEFGLRITGTDYIDEVSQKGNPDQTDWYSFTGLTITYGFDGYRSFRSGGVGCPY